MKKFLSVSELEQEDQRRPIWALNGSAQSEIGQAGEVHIGIPKVNGGTKIDALHLPQTWLPQCLTDSIPRSQLLASSEFRNAVQSKLLILITAEYAESISQQEGAEEERQLLLARKKEIREATAARSITQSGAEIVNTTEISERAAQESQVEKTDGLDPGFIMFANTMPMKADIEIINALRGRGKITRGEIKHLTKLLSDKPKTVAFLKERLSSKG